MNILILEQDLMQVLGVFCVFRRVVFVGDTHHLAVWWWVGWETLYL